MPAKTAVAEAPTLNPYAGLVGDKWWRMTHLYQIISEHGHLVPLVLRPEQERYLLERHNRNFVPKCRKYGMSTIIVIDYLDECLFAPKDRPMHAAHVDFTDDDAMAKLLIAKTAYEKGPEHPDKAIRDIWLGIHLVNPLVTNNDHELAWKNGSRQESNTSFMGGTPRRCHISEFGPLAAQRPKDAEKVKRGTFNAVPLDGIMDVETTMEGGAVGDCYLIFKAARENMDRMARDPAYVISPAGFRMFFIPWTAHPSNVLPGRTPEMEETREYFAGIQAKYGITVPPDKQAWYEDVKKVQKWDMFTQHPTVVDECLEIGSGSAFFDIPGLRFQRERAVGFETQLKWGDLTLQGDDVMNFETRSVTWSERPKHLSPFVMLEPPLPDESYLIYSDFCVGKMAEGSEKVRDTNAFGVIRKERIDPRTGEHRLSQIVASCQPNDRSITTEAIRRLVLLSIYYGDCIVMPETNNKDDIATRLQAAGCRRRWRQGMIGTDGGMPGTEKTEAVYGWLTTGTAQGGGTRGEMLDNLQEMIMQQRCILSFQWIVDQHCVFIINKHGRPEGAPGQHDDFVTGPAMGFMGLPQATKFQGPQQKLVNEFREAFVRANHNGRGL